MSAIGEVMPVVEQKPTFAQINPLVSKELFADHPDAAYWIGIIASEGVVEKPELYDAMGKLRGKVYIEQMGFLPRNSADRKGREYDEFDDQSVHLAIVANSVKNKKARLMGGSRLVLKRTAEDTMPIEGDFKEVFEHVPSDVPAAEVSRFISRDKNRMRQHTGAIALIRAMTYQTQKEGIDSVYFEIEKPLLRLLDGIGLPLQKAGEPKEVMEPGGLRTLHPIKITPSEILSSAPNDQANPFTLKEFFDSEAENGGLGYYPITLTGGKL